MDVECGVRVDRDVPAARGGLIPEFFKSSSISSRH
jgi:hypothetical protein